MSSTDYNVTAMHITRTPDVVGGKPRIAGTRVRVQDVYIWHEYHNLSADAIAREYKLSLAQVYAALTFAFDNLEAIRQAIRESDAQAERIRSQYSSKIPDNLKNE